MMTFLIAGLFMVAAAQAQTSKNCADSNAEVSACPGNYLPKVNPSATARQAVIDAIAAADKAKAAEVAAYNKLADLKFLIKGDPNQDGDYVKQLQTIQAATKIKYDLYNAAIRIASAEYNLIPPVADFTGDLRAAVLTTAKPWLPRYSEREIYDDVLRRFRPRTKSELDAEAAKSQSAIGGAGGVAAARTWSRGEISIFGQAFKNPDDLAVLIYHETSHWLDVVAKTGGGRDSDLPSVLFKSEAEAYARSAKIAQQLGRDSTQMLALAARYEMQAKESSTHDWKWVIANRRNWLSIDRRGPLAIIPTEPESSSDDEATLRQKMDALVAAATKAKALAEKAKGRFGFIKDVQEEAVRARQAVQAQDDDYTAWYNRMDALLSRAEETRRQEKAELEYRRELGRHASEFGYLSAAAGASCADSDAFVAEVRQGRYTSVSMDSSYLAEYLSMPSVAGGLSPCQVDLLSKIKDSGRSVSWSDLLAWGQQYREANPTLGRRVGRALQAFRDSFRILDTGGSSGSSSSSEERRSSDGEERSRPSRSESSGPDCFIDSNGIRACCVANCG